MEPMTETDFWVICNDQHFPLLSTLCLSEVDAWRRLVTAEGMTIAELKADGYYARPVRLVDREPARPADREE